METCEKQQIAVAACNVVLDNEIRDREFEFRSTHGCMSIYGFLYTSRMSHKSEAIGEICCLAKYGKIWGKSCCKLCISNIKRWNFLPRTSHYGATLFTLSVVKSYSDVATLTWLRKRGVSAKQGEAVEKETQLIQETRSERNEGNRNDKRTVTSTWQQRRNFLLLIMEGV
jgi:hypothetical protein